MRTPLIAIAAAAILMLGLGGCSLSPDNPRVHQLASELAKMPGVDSAEGTWTPGNITFGSNASIAVDLDPSIDPEELLAVTERWAAEADFGSGGSSLSLALERTDGSSSLHLDEATAATPSIDDLTTVWLALANTYERVSADSVDGQPSLSIRTAAMLAPSDAAETIADIADVGPALEASTWEIAPLAGQDDTGVTVSTRDGLPDADARAVLGGLDDAFRDASELGEVTLDFETAHPDAADERGDYRIAVKLSPTDLRNTPSNELNDVLLASSSWQSTLRFADAISPDDRISATFSLYRNSAFAQLVTFDCARSTDSTESPLGAELWRYWHGAGFDTECG